MPEQQVAFEAPLPWERLFPKQLAVFNSRARALLVSGSKKSGKTWAVLQRVVRHMWETPGARVGIFGKSKGQAKDFGSWQALHERHVPMWIGIESPLIKGVYFDWVTFDKDSIGGVKQDGQTRNAYFRIRNLYGGESEARLFSVEHDADIETQMQNKEFSMIYFLELSQFKDARILLMSLPQLRMEHLKPTVKGQPDLNHQWIADTNPDIDLGNRSWIYQEFYVERNKPTDDPKRRMYYEALDVVEIFSRDNEHNTEQELNELEMSCAHDPALYDSFVLGIWGDGAQKRGKLLATNFIRNYHVFPNEDEAKDLKAKGLPDDQIPVKQSSVILYGGWDLGDVNHCAVLLDCWIVKVNDVERRYWAVLDEMWSMNEEIELQELTRQMLEKIDALETINKRKFSWKHWSDDSAVNVWRPSSGSYDYQIILAASRGRIFLEGVQKPDGSVRSRVRLLRQLLTEKRIFISARCHKIIEMIEHLRRGDGKDYVLRDEYKHPFDALTYPIWMESQEEMYEESRYRPTAERTPHLIGVG